MKVLTNSQGKVLMGNGNAYEAPNGIQPEFYQWQQIPSAMKTYLDWVDDNPYTSDYTTSYFDDWTPTYNDQPIGINLSLPAGELSVNDIYSYKKAITSGINTIYNIVPNEANYNVESSDEIVATGNLKPIGTRRIIRNMSLDGNMRDLGGLPCDGGTIKFNKLIRGGGIRFDGDNARKAEIIRILHDEIGIRAELELRGCESGTYTDTILGEDVSYLAPYDGNNYWCYYSTVLSHKKELKQAFRFIFDEVKNGRPLYFHCQQGADRTGTMAVLIESLLGVPQNIIDVDYELTSFHDQYSFRKRNGREYEEGKYEYGYRDFLIALNNLSIGDTLMEKVVNLIASLGFTSQEINDFRKAVINGNPTTVVPEISTYSVTKIVSNVSVVGEDDATQYQGYEANLAPTNDYVISSINITMNGVDVTGEVFSGEKTNLRYSVTNNLSHCSTNNTKISSIESEGYGATLTPDNEYTFDGGTITITMGGIDVSTYYSNGKIAIPSVTGNIIITATAVPTAQPYTNLADTTESTNPTDVRDTAWKTGYRITSSGFATQSGKTICNAIKIELNDVVRIKNVQFGSEDRYAIVGMTRGTYLQYISSLPSTYLTHTIDGDVHEFTLIDDTNFSDWGDIYLSLCFTTPVDKSAVIITKNEEIV